MLAVLDAALFKYFVPILALSSDSLLDLSLI
jgi:hypothetical protein